MPIIHFAFLPLPFHRAVSLPPTSTIFAPDGTGHVVVFLKTCPIVGTPYLMPTGRFFFRGDGSAGRRGNRHPLLGSVRSNPSGMREPGDYHDCACLCRLAWCRRCHRLSVVDLTRRSLGSEDLDAARDNAIGRRSDAAAPSTDDLDDSPLDQRLNRTIQPTVLDIPPRVAMSLYDVLRRPVWLGVTEQDKVGEKPQSETAYGRP